jgi:integrase
MAGYIEDRWFKKGPADPETGKPTREKTELHGKCLRYRVCGIPGVRKRSFEHLVGPDGARAWLAKAQHESTRGEFVDPRDGRILLSDYIRQEWLPNRSGDPGTIEGVTKSVGKHIVRRPIGRTSLNAVKVPQLRVWLKELEAELSPGTIQVVWGYLSSILQAAVDDERITKNPCKAKTVGPPELGERLARAWTRQQIAVVREAIDPRFQILVDLGVGAGLRQGEAIGLSVDDIDEEAGLLRVRRQVKKVHNRLVFAPPKGGKTRVVPLPTHLAERLRAHLKAFPARKETLPWVNPDEPENERQAEERAPQTHELVVTAAWKGPVRRDTWNSRYWKPALVEAGIIPRREGEENAPRQSQRFVASREHGFHCLRHTFASVMLDAREPIVAVSRWMGHADASITLKIYAHMMPEADGRGRAAMDAWFEANS